MRKFKQVLTGRGSGYSIYSVNGGALRRWGLALLVMITVLCSCKYQFNR